MTLVVRHPRSRREVEQIDGDCTFPNRDGAGKGFELACVFV